MPKYLHQEAGKFLKSIRLIFLSFSFPFWWCVIECQIMHLLHITGGLYWPSYIVKVDEINGRACSFTCHILTRFKEVLILDLNLFKAKVAIQSLYRSLVRGRLIINLIDKRNLIV